DQPVRSATVTETTAKAEYRAIKQNVTSRSEAEIHSWLRDREGGVDQLLDLIFAQFPASLRADKVKGTEIDFQYNLDTPEARRVDDASRARGTCRCGRGALPAPTVTMTMDVSVFLRVLIGETMPVRAFLTGKIKVRGDMMAATKFETWFTRPDE